MKKLIFCLYFWGSFTSLTAQASEPCVDHLNVVVHNRWDAIYEGESVTADADAAIIFDKDQKLLVNSKSPLLISNKSTQDGSSEVEVWSKFSSVDGDKIVQNKIKKKFSFKKNSDGRVTYLKLDESPNGYDSETFFSYKDGKCRIDSFMRPANSHEKVASNITKTVIYDRRLCDDIKKSVNLNRINIAECSKSFRLVSEALMLRARSLEEDGIFLSGSENFRKSVSSSNLNPEIFSTLEKCSAEGFYVSRKIEASKPSAAVPGKAKPAPQVTR